MFFQKYRIEMDQQKKIKIALLGHRLNYGGAEKVMATLSNYFVKQNIDVHVIVVLNELGYSYSGTLLNLGEYKSESSGFLNKLMRLRLLAKYLKKENFDYVIDFRNRSKYKQEWFLSKFVFPKNKTIYTVHSSKLDSFFSPNIKFAQKMYASNCEIVAICDQMKTDIEHKYDLKNVTRIYNPIDFDFIEGKSKESFNFPHQYIFAAGHFDSGLKQFDILISMYAKSVLPQKNIHLVLAGKGELRTELENIAKKFELADKVHFVGFQENPYKWMHNAKFYVLSSLYEGLPMVLVEALACETPLVAFDCPYGPNEIVVNNSNGILVENQNQELFVAALNKMILEEEFYNKCKQNAKASANKFHVDCIANQWFKLMNLE